MSLTAMAWVMYQCKGPSHIERWVLMAIADAANDDGTDAWPSLRTLADAAGITRSSASGAIKRLEQQGQLLVLRPTRQGRGQHNRYTLVMGRDPEKLAGELRWPPRQKGSRDDNLSPLAATRRPLVADRAADGGTEAPGGDEAAGSGRGKGSPDENLSGGQERYGKGRVPTPKGSGDENLSGPERYGKGRGRYGKGRGRFTNTSENVLNYRTKNPEPTTTTKGRVAKDRPAAENGGPQAPSLESDLEAARGHPGRRRGAGEVLDEANRWLRDRGEPTLTSRNRRELFDDLVDLLAAGHQPEALVQAVVFAPSRTPRAVEFELGRARAGPGGGGRRSSSEPDFLDVARKVHDELSREDEAQ
jgi:hypothetical protein